MTRTELATLLWTRHVRVAPPDPNTLKTWIQAYGKAALERAFTLTADRITSEWFGNRHVMSADEVYQYAVGVLRGGL